MKLLPVKKRKIAILFTGGLGDTLLYTPLLKELKKKQFTVTCIFYSPYSHDPNDKQVSPRGCGPAGLIHRDQPLTYLIQFQNLGTAPAQRVIIRDLLDDGLDLVKPGCL